MGRTGVLRNLNGRRAAQGQRTALMGCDTGSGDCSTTGSTGLASVAAPLCFGSSLGGIQSFHSFDVGNA